MPLLTLLSSALLTASFCPRALASTCSELEAGAAPVRLFPWPRPTAEMIAALESFAATPPWRGHADLAAALAEAPSADRVILRLFHPVPLNDVRAYYGPEGEPPPDKHPLGVDGQGLRSLLARTLEFIKDHDRQLEWMEYLGYDSSLTVRVNVVRTVLSWANPVDRDAFVMAGLAPVSNPAVVMAALTQPEALSPAVRWRLITVALNPRRMDPAILQALNTFAQKDLLRAWYQDLISATRLGDALRTYDPAWRGRMLSAGDKPISMHQKTAINQGDVLAQLAGVEVRGHWLTEVTRIAADRTALGDFAAEILKQARMRIEAEDTDVRARLAWTAEQMTNFERSLKPTD